MLKALAKRHDSPATRRTERIHSILSPPFSLASVPHPPLGNRPMGNGLHFKAILDTPRYAPWHLASVRLVFVDSLRCRRD